MKKIFLPAFICFANMVMAQEPYINSGAGQGLGQYGYLNLNATTFSRLDRNTYNNVNSLAARWYLNGSVVLYNVSGGSEWAANTNWQCGSSNAQNLNTANYNSSDFGANWAAGNDAYVSVYAYYCGGASSHTSGAGFNERKFTLIDVNTNAPSPSIGTTVSGGGCNSKVVGTFTINPGTTGKTLERFFMQNSGTATETALGNTQFKLYYEPATGTELFDGTESNAQLYGDYGGDATNNNIFGHNALGISLNGNTRFYVVACNNPSISGTVNLSIINDGINIGPNNNGSYGLLRINALSLGGPVVLPVQLTSFKASAVQGNVLLNWSVADNNTYASFVIERSADGINFASIGNVPANGTSMYTYTDQQPVANNYYRLRIIDKQSNYSYSGITAVSTTTGSRLIVSPNPASSFISIKNSRKNDQVTITSSAGVLLLNTTLRTNEERIPVSSFPKGNYFIRITGNGVTTVQQLVIIN